MRYQRLEQRIEYRRRTPETPTAKLVNTLAIAYRDCGEFDLSISAAEETVRIDPGYSDANVTLCLDLALNGDDAQAADIAEQILTKSPDFKVTEYTQQHPYRDTAVLERIAGALKLVGLPG